MSCDLMGPKQRAWYCCHYGSLRDPLFDFPTVLLARGERPVLGLPPDFPDEYLELAFGWAMAQVVEQRHGWLELVRRVLDLGRMVASVAAACWLWLDLNHDGIPDVMQVFPAHWRR